MPLRDQFPKSNSLSTGAGESDGNVYKTAFSGATLEKSYAMVRQFLMEEGYGDVPLPKDAEELSLFKLTVRNSQLVMFGENGYVHNPIKILFPIKSRKKTTLLLEIYNEKAPGHLLRFHGILNTNTNDGFGF